MNEPVIIDEEFKNLLPPLSDEERERLKKLCLRDGIEDPLKVWNGILIDGHNRYEISEEYDLNYEIKDKTEDLLTRADVINWIIENQGARRNLTKSQLMQAYSKYEEERAKEAKERQANSTGGAHPQLSSNLHEAEPIRTAAEVAAKIGVSENTYRNMKTIVNEGTQEQIDRMDGKVKVKGKANSVSGIKAEIEKDKKVVEEQGTDEQKERMKKGGDGNKPTEIANEIDPNRNNETKICIKCGKRLHISCFYKGRNQCKTCCDERPSKSHFKDVKGNIIQFSGQYTNVPSEEILSGFEDDGKEEKVTAYEISGKITGFTLNFSILIGAIMEDINSGRVENEEEVINTAIVSLDKLKDEVSKSIKALTIKER